MTPPERRDPDLEARILEVLGRPEYASLTLSHLLVVLRWPRGDRREIRSALRSLGDQGRVVKEGSHFRLPHRRPSTLEGPISMTRDGYGFVADPGSPEGDIFVPAAKTQGAMNGDLVEIRVTYGRDGRRVGQVSQVLDRTHHRVLGQYRADLRGGRVLPWDRKLGFEVLVAPPPPRLGVRPGDFVRVALVSYPSHSRGHPVGEVERVIGHENDPRSDSRLAAEAFGLREEFSTRALSEAKKAVRDFPGSFESRIDLREHEIFTIDGEDAKDFDDAVSVEAGPGGRWILSVHVADVGHYVLEGSALDLEAKERGNSVYFPDRVIPMLPPAISDDLGSLVPARDRFAITVRMHFDSRGKRVDQQIHPSVIRSVARLVYPEVQAYLETGETSESVAGVRDSLKTMAQLAAILKAGRLERGSLDFQFAEKKFLLDGEGHVIGVKPLGDPRARNLIEEFMIAANETVAEFLYKLEIPLVFRVHESPDEERLRDLMVMLGDLGIRTTTERLVTSKGLQEVFRELEARNVPDAVKLQILRSLKQARYQEEQGTHFGLASRLYAHFTSPIRRYPDLLVHRLLKDAIGFATLTAKTRESLLRSLEERAEHASRTERRAMEAERMVKNMKAARLMSGFIGERFQGHVVGVSAFGVFVALDDPFVEGLIPLSELPPDRYRMLREGIELVGELAGQRFFLGQRLEVQVIETGILRGEVVFTLGTRRRASGGPRMRGRPERPVPAPDRKRRGPTRGRRGS